MRTKTNMNITKFSKMNIKKWEQFLSDKDTDKGYTTEHLEHPDEQMKDMKLVGDAKDTQVKCLVPLSSGVVYTELKKDNLWDKYYTNAPRLRAELELFSPVK